MSNDQRELKSELRHWAAEESIHEEAQHEMLNAVTRIEQLEKDLAAALDMLAESEDVNEAYQDSASKHWKRANRLEARALLAESALGKVATSLFPSGPILTDILFEYDRERAALDVRESV